MRRTHRLSGSRTYPRAGFSFGYPICGSTPSAGATASAVESTPTRRIRPLVAFVLMALSEFTDVRRKAWPKQELIAKMVHTNIPRVSRLLSEAADLGVLAKDRNRPGGRCCYTFAESWVRWFSDGEQTCRSDKSEPESPRLTVAGATSLDLPERQVSTEPVQVNQDQDPAAEEDRTSLLEIAREPAPAFDTGSAFLPGSLCPSCRMVDSGGAVCSRCCAVGSEGARLPARPAAEPAYLAAGDYGARPSADWNAGGD